MVFERHSAEKEVISVKSELDLKSSKVILNCAKKNLSLGFRVWKIGEGTPLYLFLCGKKRNEFNFIKFRP